MMAPVSVNSENDPRYQGWRVACASAIGVFFASTFVYGFAVLLGPISRDLGWSRQSVSTAYSLMATVSALCAPAVGALLDRHGPRRIAVPCVALCGLGMASLSALTESLAQIYAVFAVMGVAGIGTSALAYSRAVSTWFDARRGVALAIVISGGAVASISHPPATEASLLASLLIGVGLGGELDITPFLLSRYFGLRAVSTLYGFAWTAMGMAGAVGPFLMGRAFDQTGSYDGVLQWLSVSTLAAAILMLILPSYNLRTQIQPVAAGAAD